jgi:AcrR family transcriptional regulator
MGRVAGLSRHETKQRVLDAAAEVFAEHGYEGARVAQIAEAAGLSVGAIYNNYESKAELLAAVVERDTASELTRLFTSDRSGSTLDLIEHRGHQLQAGPPGSALLAEMILAARRDPEVAAILRRRIDERERLFSDFVRLGQSAGDVASDLDAAVVARFSLMLGLGALLVRAMDLPPTDQGAWDEFITRVVDRFRPEEQ